MNDSELEDLEYELLLEAIRRRHGYDFRHYSQASLRRRVRSLRNAMGLDQVSELITPILHDPATFNAFLREASVTVTEMFRDPQFYAVVRSAVAPRLATYPVVKVWHAGCATGEEVYSLAILLHEEGLLDRAQIYATDFNNESLDRARDGIYPLDKMKSFLSNYNSSVPKGSFSDYYISDARSAKMAKFLSRNITFANHNLVTDGVFGEMQLVVCRNVLIYFDKVLQDRVLRLFWSSLSQGGFLCLGSMESMESSSVAQNFVAVAEKERVFRKKTLESAVAVARSAGS